LYEVSDEIYRAQLKSTRLDAGSWVYMDVVFFVFLLSTFIGGYTGDFFSAPFLLILAIFCITLFAILAVERGITDKLEIYENGFYSPTRSLTQIIKKERRFVKFSEVESVSFVDYASFCIIYLKPPAKIILPTGYRPTDIGGYIILSEILAKRFLPANKRPDMDSIKKAHNAYEKWRKSKNESDEQEYEDAIQKNIEKNPRNTSRDYIEYGSPDKLEKDIVIARLMFISLCIILLTAIIVCIVAFFIGVLGSVDAFAIVCGLCVFLIGEILMNGTYRRYYRRNFSEWIKVGRGIEDVRGDGDKRSRELNRPEVKQKLGKQPSQVLEVLYEFSNPSELCPSCEYEFTASFIFEKGAKTTTVSCPRCSHIIEKRITKDVLKKAKKM